MPTVHETIEQLEDEIGLPIVLLTAWDTTTQKSMSLLLRDLPLAARVFIVQWLSDRLSGP